MSTIAEKKETKRLKILDSAYSLFIAKSFNSTAVDDVVKLAGVAKGTFYLYFKDKYDLLNQITAWKSSELLLEAINASEKSTENNIAEKINFIADYIIDTFIKHPEFAALINNRFSACFNLILSNESNEFSEVINAFSRLLSLCGCTYNEIKKTLYIIMDMVGSLCCDAVLGKCPYSIQEIKPEISGIINHLMERGNING